MNYLVILLLASAPILSAQGLSSLLGGSNAKKIQGVAVKASLGCTNGQILKYVSANSQFECADDSGGSGAGDVEGGTNLTTAGAIPYVSVSGTLSQDTAIVRVSSGIFGATTYRSGDGSTTTPPYSFTSETNTGMYRVNSRNLGFVVNGSPILGMGDNGGNYVRFANASIQFTTNIGAGGDLGLSRSSANNLGITNGSSTTYWTLGSNGITCGSGDGNSAACDVGTTGARVRNVNAAGTISGNYLLAGTANYIGWNNRSTMYSTADGNILLTNASLTDFGRLQFGGSTSSFPALKRSSTTLQARLADDSADAPISASNVTASADFIGSSTSCIYLGATGTDGSWRFCRSSNDLVVSRRESGSWVAKGTWAP